MVGIIEARFRKCKYLLEQIGHRSFVIIPHEMAVIPKGTAPCTISAACVALAQIGDSLEKFLLSEDIIIFTNQLSVILSVYFHIFI